MSTRSGKRIHNSFHEIAPKKQVEHGVQSERKTRSRRVPEIGDELSASVVKTKKRTNYVSFPTDDEVSPDTEAQETKPARSLRNNALKELNVLSSDTEHPDPVAEVSKQVRTTRRTRKLGEDAENEQQKHEEEVASIGKTKKTKKGKKKKSIEQKEEESMISKKKMKKKLKKGKRSKSMVVEDTVPQDKVDEGRNKSNMSVDSFHSAAGSPVKRSDDVPDTMSLEMPEQGALKTDNNFTEMPTNEPEARRTRHTRSAAGNVGSHNSPNTTLKKSHKRKTSSNLEHSKSVDQEQATEFDTTLTNVPNKRRSSIRNQTSVERNTDETFDKITQNSSFNVEELQKRKSEIKAALVNTTYDKSEAKLDTTFDKNKTDDNYVTNKESSEFSTSSAEKQTLPTKLNSTFEKDNNKSQIDSETDNILGKPAIDTTSEKDKCNKTPTRKSEIINTTYEKESDVSDSNNVPTNRKSSIVNLTYDKDNISTDSVLEIEHSTKSLRKSMCQANKQSPKLNNTFDKEEKTNGNIDETPKSDTTFDKNQISDTTFDKYNKLDTTFDKNSKSSLISSDNSNIRDSTITLDKSEISRISITSDDSKENIMNTTPVLIESSLELSKINSSKISPKTPTIAVTNSSVTPKKGSTSKSSTKSPAPVTPLKREGTFTKEQNSDLSESTQKKLSKTPTRKMSLPSPGCTPFPGSKYGTTIMNVTRSLEKSRRSSCTELPRATRVMFCSPGNNPAVVMQQRSRVIKSNLKGSNKSFVFEEEGGPGRAAPRKRSYTHSEAEEARAKRSRLEPAPPARAARTRTASAGHAAPSVPRPVTPKRSEARISRTKLPNFAALHRKEFSKMESLDECQERRARRARLLLTPTGAVTVLDRSSPRESIAEPERKKSPNHTIEQPAPKPKKSKGKEPQSSKKGKEISSSKKDKESQPSKKEKVAKKPETPVKSLPTLKSLNPGYTRFGFKLNYDVNPFSIPINPNASLMFSNKKNTIKKDNTKPLKELKAQKRHSTMPVLAGVSGATSRKEIAKQTVMREKSFPDKRSLMRNENRTVIKGVRTNRRFELQMRMRNID